MYDAKIKVLLNYCLKWQFNLLFVNSTFINALSIGHKTHNYNN